MDSPLSWAEEAIFELLVQCTNEEASLSARGNHHTLTTKEIRHIINKYQPKD